MSVVITRPGGTNERLAITGKDRLAQKRLLGFSYDALDSHSLFVGILVAHLHTLIVRLNSGAQWGTIQYCVAQRLKTSSRALKYTKTKH